MCKFIVTLAMVMLLPGMGSATPFTYSYDALGRLTGFTMPAGNQTTYGYDANGNRTQEKIIIQAAFDPDTDGLPTVADNCSAKANASQVDVDKDGKGDACDAINWGQWMAGYYSTIGNKDGVTTEQFMIANGLSSATQVPSLPTSTTGVIVKTMGISGLSFDAGSNRLYFAEQSNHLIRHVNLSTGQTTKMAGTGNAWMSGYADGTGSAAQFKLPQQVAVSADGAWLYVADYGNCVIRRVNTATNAVTTYAGVAPCADDPFIHLNTTSHQDGAALSAKFYWPRGIAVASDGTVYVGDTYNGAVRKISTSGSVTTLAGGPGNTIGMNRPNGLVLIGTDLYVADSGARVVWKINTANGAAAVVVGKLNTAGSKSGVTGSAALLNYPLGIAGAGNTLYVVDQGQNAVLQIDIANNYFTSKLVGDEAQRGFVDGAFASAKIDIPQWVTLDTTNNVLYLADISNVAVRKLNLGPKTVTTFIGLPEIKNKYVDGDGSVARFSSPMSIARVNDYTLLVADAGNCAIRKLALDASYGQVANGKFNHSVTVSTLAGSPGMCATWSSGPYPLNTADKPNGGAAILYEPRAITADSAGTYAYVASGDRTIRRVTAGGSSAGATRLVAGAALPAPLTVANYNTLSPNVDGTGTGATFSLIYDLIYVDEAVSGGGTTPALYVIVTTAVRRISLAASDYGKVTTVFGHPSQSGDQNGTGTTARFNGLGNVTVLTRNGTQYLYVTDFINHKVYELNLQTQQVKTLAGSGVKASTDGTGTSAAFATPAGITAVSLSDNVQYLYVGEMSTSKLRMVDLDTLNVTTVAGSGVMGASDGVGAQSDWGTIADLLYLSTHNRIFVTDMLSRSIRQLTPDL